MMMCIFPVIFLFVTFHFALSYLLISLITLIIFGISLTCIIIFLKKSEDVYALIADHSSIILKNARTIPWSDIDKIETFSQSMMGNGHKRYLRLVLKSGERIILDASDYDIWYEDLRDELIKLKTINS